MSAADAVAGGDPVTHTMPYQIRSPPTKDPNAAATSHHRWR
jgi:hypothetical protein